MQPSARSNSLGAFPVDPQYVQGGRPTEIWAHFRSGIVLEASCDRVRHYPGLSGVAPATLSLYLRGDEFKTAASHVLDAGCGAGEGLRHLAARYRRVTGVDKDGKAVAFARQIASDAHAIQADLQAPNLRCDPVQLAYVVDVLAHLEQPERTLWNLAQRMDGARALLVAEAKASAEQCLAPPARRA
jgi:SAM-dependent methyltransferase